MGFSKKKKPKRVNQISDRQREENRIYRKLRKKFIKENPVCVCHAKLNCGSVATDVHHTQGRRMKLLNDTEKWLPVCRVAHLWIHNNPVAAAAHGWICQKGLWNTST